MDQSKTRCKQRMSCSKLSKDLGKILYIGKIFLSFDVNFRFFCRILMDDGNILISSFSYSVSLSSTALSSPVNIKRRYSAYTAFAIFQSHLLHGTTVSIIHKSIAGCYRPVRVADGPITVRCRFIKNASWDSTQKKQICKLLPRFNTNFFWRICLCTKFNSIHGL